MATDNYAIELNYSQYTFQLSTTFTVDKIVSTLSIGTAAGFLYNAPGNTIEKYYYSKYGLKIIIGSENCSLIA